MPEFVEWMMGAPPGWTEGVSRTQRLKMLGNGVQVQVGELLGHALREYVNKLRLSKGPL
jgi:site-specific DNA-cytosine methylase